MQDEDKVRDGKNKRQYNKEPNDISTDEKAGNTYQEKRDPMQKYDAMPHTAIRADNTYKMAAINSWFISVIPIAKITKSSYFFSSYL